MKDFLPEEVKTIIKRLNQKGYRCFAVGGCVRDWLMGKTPKDFDLCTSAHPEEIQKVFWDVPVQFTGAKHGTVTVIIKGQPLEITTFRRDGIYLDGRHPQQVVFVGTLQEDLARRDFTINAMAYHPDRGLIDLYGGQKDLERKMIRCVGQPEKRFEEDALRMMRALRFAAVLGFKIEEKTQKALLSHWEGIYHISAERLQKEWDRLLCGEAAGEILRIYEKPIQLWLWGEKRTVCWNVAVSAMEKAPREPGIRLACLFMGWEPKLARQRLGQMRYPKKIQYRVETALKYEGVEIQATQAGIKRYLRQIGEEGLRDLLNLQMAKNRSEKMISIEKILDRILDERQCFSLDSLKIKGMDIVHMGVRQGPKVGEILNRILDKVIEEEVPNEREELLTIAKRIR